MSHLKRIRIPAVLDLVKVLDAEHIRLIEDSGDVDRLHAFPTSDLPGWVRFYFSATRFYDRERDLWFCPFEPAHDPEYVRRRAVLEEKIAEGYRPEDVEQVADLLRSGADDAALAQAVAPIVNRRFYRDEIPPERIRQTDRALRSFSQVLSPIRYRRARRAMQQIGDYSAEQARESVCPIDAGHNLGAVSQVFVQALRILVDHPDEPIEEIFTTNPLTLQTPRVALRATTFGGLLKRPAKPGKTVFLYEIGEAAKATGEILFTFGSGTESRVCVFKDFFLPFMADLQRVLHAP